MGILKVETYRVFLGAYGMKMLRSSVLHSLVHCEHIGKCWFKFSIEKEKKTWSLIPSHLTPKREQGLEKIVDGQKKLSLCTCNDLHISTDPKP